MSYLTSVNNSMSSVMTSLEEFGDTLAVQK